MGQAFWTGVRLPSSPPKQYNPNLVPIGHGFGFILLYEWKKLKTGHRKSGRTADHGNPPDCFM